MIIARRESELTARNTLRVHGIIIASFMALIGIQFLRPEKTFATAPIYDVMAQWAREETWGAILLVVGSARLLLIFYGIVSFNYRSQISSACASFASAAVWFAMAIVFYEANPWGWSCVGTLCFTFLDGSTSVMVARIAGATKGRVLHGGTFPYR